MDSSKKLTVIYTCQNENVSFAILEIKLISWTSELDASGLDLS